MTVRSGSSCSAAPHSLVRANSSVSHFLSVCRVFPASRTHLALPLPASGRAGGPPPQAQTWFNEHLCKAIERCPRKAVVVLDNVHLLEGEEIWLLDKMLSLTDGEK